MGATEILIIGDSISSAYSPLVKATLSSRNINVEQIFAGDCTAILTGLSEWLPDRSPELILFNCGLHDARFFVYSHAYQQTLNSYQVHLRGIVKWLKERTQSRLLWASTTPAIPERITLDYMRFPQDILAYNAVAKGIMDEAGIPVVDLHASLLADTPCDCVGADGVHMTERGNHILAESVVAGILACLGSR